MYKSLHSYIETLEQRKELIRVRRFTDPVLEMAEIADRMVKSGGKALLFENTGTDFPVAMNLYGTSERTMLALGLNSYNEIEGKIDRLFHDVILPKKNLWEKLKLLPTLTQVAQWMPKISGGRGACQEVVMPQPDLSKLPILKCWPHDGGRFITLPMVHTKDPLTGARNVGMYRMQVFSESTLGVHWHFHKTGAKHFRTAIANGAPEKFPVAIALGGDLVYSYCATAPMPDNMDEYLLAGFLRNKRVKLVRCLTQPLEVPADADFIIEGYIDISEQPVVEGPFGDHTGFYSLEDLYPMMHVTCITHRKDAIYPATVVGIPPHEDAFLSQATENLFLAPIRLALAPEIKALHLPVEGVSHNIAIIKIENQYPGQAVKTVNALWGAGQMMFNKMMVVVDGEVDITNYSDLLEYVSQNYNPATDTHFSFGPLDVLDHAAARPACGGKICIDATTKGCSNQPAGAGNEAIRASQLFSFIHKGDPIPPSRIVVQFDEQVDLEDTSMCVWLMGGNTDVARDCKIENNQLLIDATSKAQQLLPRRWPNVVCSNAATIKTVNDKWASYGFGKFIFSPSLKYQSLLLSNDAAVTPFIPEKPELKITPVIEEKAPVAIQPEIVVNTEKQEVERLIVDKKMTIVSEPQEEIVAIETSVPALEQEELQMKPLVIEEQQELFAANVQEEIKAEEELEEMTFIEDEPATVNENVDTACYHSPVGYIKIEASQKGICSLLFSDEALELPATTNAFIKDCVQQLDEYFAGKRQTFELPIDMAGSDFQLRVWNELRKIPYGETISYAELSKRIGDTKAVRAVGHANGQNKINIIIPCHRVIGANRKLVGYAGGLHRKEWLLKHELQNAGTGLFKVISS